MDDWDPKDNWYWKCYGELFTWLLVYILVLACHDAAKAIVMAWKAVF